MSIDRCPKYLEFSILSVKPTFHSRPRQEALMSELSIHSTYIHIFVGSTIQHRSIFSYSKEFQSINSVIGMFAASSECLQFSCWARAWHISRRLLIRYPAPRSSPSVSPSSPYLSRLNCAAASGKGFQSLIYVDAERIKEVIRHGAITTTRARRSKGREYFKKEF